MRRKARRRSRNPKPPSLSPSSKGCPAEPIATFRRSGMRALQHSWRHCPRLSSDWAIPAKGIRGNRHNVGFMVLDALAREESGIWSTDSFPRTCRAQIAGHPVLLVNRLTFMNASGKGCPGAAFHPQEGAARILLLVVDDLNLPFGRIRDQGTRDPPAGIMASNRSSRCWGPRRSCACGSESARNRCPKTRRTSFCRIFRRKNEPGLTK